MARTIARSLRIAALDRLDLHRTHTGQRQISRQRKRASQHLSTTLECVQWAATYLEVQRDQGEDQRLEILHEVVEYSETLRVLGLVDVD